MQEQIELTPAELEMIRIKREKDALEEQEKAAKKLLKFEEDIKSEKKKIEDKIKWANQQNEAAQAFLPTLGDGWSLKKNKHTEKFNVVDRGAYNSEKNDYEYVNTIWEEAIDFEIYLLQKNGYTVEVKEHFVSSKYSYRQTSKGFKMFPYDGFSWKETQKFYTKGNRINEIIKEKEDIATYQEKSKQLFTMNVENIIADFNNRFPDATVTQDTEYTSRVGLSNIIILEFKNGIKIKYDVDSTNYSRRSVAFGRATKEKVENFLYTFKNEA